jgi:hypothetical protein
MKNSLHFNIMLIVALLTVTSISFCKKEPKLLTAKATIIDMGQPAADGCGWMVKIDSTYYNPVNLPDDYKKANTTIKISYYLLATKYQCGIAANLKYSQIDIESVNK